MPEVFWWNNPSSLVTRENWKQFVPRGPFNVHYLNSIARFFLYLGIISWLYYQRIEIVLLTIIGLLITIVVYKKYLEPYENFANSKIHPQILLSSSIEAPNPTSTPISEGPFSAEPVSQIGGCCGGRSNPGWGQYNNIDIPSLINSLPKDEYTMDPKRGCYADPRFEVPVELFDQEQGQLGNLKTLADDKIISKSIETNGLPNDNQANMGVLPDFDLRPGTGTQTQNFDTSQSLLLQVGSWEAKGNHFGCEPAPTTCVLQNAFQMGDRLGDNIRRDTNIHSSSIDLNKTPNNQVCGRPKNPFGANGNMTCGKFPSGKEITACGKFPSGQEITACGPCKYGGEVNCQMSTTNNPFGNVLPTDNVANPNRGPSCLDRDDTDNKWTMAASTAAAATGALASGGQGLFRNVNDVFDRNNGQMAFNTLPSTTIPNDLDALKKFFFHVPYVCKDGDMEACYAIDELQTRKAGQINAL